MDKDVLFLILLIAVLLGLGMLAVSTLVPGASQMLYHCDARPHIAKGGDVWVIYGEIACYLQ